MTSKSRFANQLNRHNCHHRKTFAITTISSAANYCVCVVKSVWRKIPTTINGIYHKGKGKFFNWLVNGVIGERHFRRNFSREISTFALARRSRRGSCQQVAGRYPSRHRFLTNPAGLVLEIAIYSTILPLRYKMHLSGNGHFQFYDLNSPTFRVRKKRKFEGCDWV